MGSTVMTVTIALCKVRRHSTVSVTAIHTLSPSYSVIQPNCIAYKARKGQWAGWPESQNLILCLFHPAQILLFLPLKS